MDWLPRGIDPHGSSNGIDQTDRTPRHFFRHGPPAIMEVERDVIYTGLAEAVGHVDHITRLPPLDLEYSDDTRNELAQIVGGLSAALAQSFLVIDPRVKHPNTEHWERAFQLFNLLL